MNWRSVSRKEASFFLVEDNSPRSDFQHRNSLRRLRPPAPRHARAVLGRGGDGGGGGECGECVEGEAFFHRAPAEPAEKDGRAENGAAVKADEEVDDEGKHGGDDDAAAAQQRGAALV